MLTKWIIATVATLSLVVSAANAHAEVQKFMNISGGKMLPYFRLIATPPNGWVVEEEATKKYGVQMLVPKGKNFGNAAALIYVKVSYRQKDTDQAQFIKSNNDNWLAEVPDAKITKMPDVTRTNGKPAFQLYQYVNPSVPKQPFEYLAFGEDSDKDGNTFNLMITVTGGNQKVIEKAAGAYNEFLRSH
jgi:hypothetical protein